MRVLYGMETGSPCCQMAYPDSVHIVFITNLRGQCEGVDEIITSVNYQRGAHLKSTRTMQMRIFRSRSSLSAPSIYGVSIQGQMQVAAIRSIQRWGDPRIRRSSADARCERDGLARGGRVGKCCAMEPISDQNKLNTRRGCSQP